jgi:hypothetical protein
MQEEVAAGYRATLAELTAQGERIETIDGEAPPDAVFEAMLAAIARLGNDGAPGAPGVS